MSNIQRIYEKIDSVTADNFEELAVELFHLQYKRNLIYNRYIKALKKDVSTIKNITDIPFLPIEFFKRHHVTVHDSVKDAVAVFKSSGTTSTNTSKHFLFNLAQYQINSRRIFEDFYGSLDNYIILALLPSYLENGESSLVAMIEGFISNTKNPLSGFFRYNYEELLQRVDACRVNFPDKKIIIWGVSFALLDLAENYKPNLSDCIIMETGGMKGRRKEITRDELQEQLKINLNVNAIHSEYGMTELLSQCYSKGEGIFSHSRTMRVLCRDVNDPFDVSEENKRTGALNIIDLSNVESCAFIETKDLGIVNKHSFEVKGRMDNSDIRGCNLLYEL